ncbi:unnamed protein product [Sympodiomycopsis kandeliae]
MVASTLARSAVRIAARSSTEISVSTGLRPCASGSTACLRPGHARSLYISPALRAVDTNAAPSSLSSSKPSAEGKKTSSQSQKKSPDPDSGKGGFRMPLKATLYVLLTSSVLLTGVGLYQFYNAFQTWPKDLREDLRAAVKFRRDGEWKGAELKFRSAIAKAQSMSPEELGSDPLLKLTGIWIALASMFEESNQIDKAYVAYQEGFKLCLTNNRSSPSEKDTVAGRNGPERARAVAISQKLGELALKIADLGPNSAAATAAKLFQSNQTPAQKALKYIKKDEESSPSPSSSGQPEEIPEVIPFETRKEAANAAEDHLVWCVEELLRLTVPENVQQQAALVSANQREQSKGGESAESSPSSVSLADLDLPPWVTKTDLLASLESLGSFYARAGKTEYAVPLFLQALEFLIPTNSQRPKSSITISDRCKAAIIMNNLSQVFLNDDVNLQTNQEFIKAKNAHGSQLNQSIAWAKKGLDLIQNTNTKAGWILSDNNSSGSSKVSAAKELIGSEDAIRTQQVKEECLLTEITLLINLGALSQMKDDKCDARNYLQRAYRLANQEGYREARIRAAGILSSLQR